MCMGKIVFLAGGVVTKPFLCCVDSENWVIWGENWQWVSQSECGWLLSLKTLPDQGQPNSMTLKSPGRVTGRICS